MQLATKTGSNMKEGVFAMFAIRYLDHMILSLSHSVPDNCC